MASRRSRRSRLRGAALRPALLASLITACAESGPSEPSGAVVRSIEVSPSSATLNWIGASRGFSGVARDADGSAIDGVEFTWSSSAPGVASVDAASGVATAAAAGATTIRAAVGAVTGVASLSVSQVLATIEVTPTAHAFATLGRTVSLSAVARDSGSVVVPGQTFTWMSSDTTIARVDGAGVVTAVRPGNATVVVSTAGKSDSTAIEVAQVVATLLVSPDRDTVFAAGQTRAFSAMANDSGGAPVTNPALTWSSSDSTVATVDSLTGVATATGPGVASITAHAGGTSDPGVLVVRDGVVIGDYVLLTDFGSPQTHAYVVGDIFAVWWDPTVDDFEADAQVILDRLIGIRQDALDAGWLDPPNPGKGLYLNIYLHVPGPGNDHWPDHFGNGVGTDSNFVPYLSLPTGSSAGSGFHLDRGNVRHEGAHLFQYTHSSTGYDYFGDARWFTEASANWFAAFGLPGENGPFIAAACIPANPQLALWHGFDNAAPGDPKNWNRDTRQYAMNTWLHWLTTVGGQSIGVIVDGYNAGTTMLPQEWMASQVPNLGELFADWAAHNTADMDYLSAAQWAAAQNEIVVYGDPADIHPYVAELDADGTAGAWLASPAALLPRSWAYNVIRVSAPAAATYDFELDGAASGSEGAAARFEARVLVRTPTGDAIHEVTMSNDQDGALSVDVPATATDLYLIIASVPDHFRGNQTYAYGVRIGHD